MFNRLFQTVNLAALITPVSPAPTRRIRMYVLLGALLFALPLVAHAQQDSRNGVSISAYVNHDNLDSLKMTLTNDNSYSVKDISFTIQYTCGNSDHTTSPGHSAFRIDSWPNLAAGANVNLDVDSCTGKINITSVRMLSFTRGN